MKKKNIIIVIAILAIVSIIIGIRELYYTTGKELSKEEFELLINKINENSNYKIETIAKERIENKTLDDKIIEKYTEYKKDELYANIDENDKYTSTRSNSETKELIQYTPNSKTYVIYDMNKLTGVDEITGKSEYEFIRI